MSRFLLTLSLSAVALTASAVTPLWLRDAAISPDGSRIAFTYKGDIFTVPTGGGNATRLTTLDSHEASPIWSPDGSKIAFASDREGSFDIFVMDSTGGTPLRLTRNSAKEVPVAFTPDGKYVIFSAAIQDPAESALFPTARLGEVYKVAVDGGRTTRMLATPAETMSWSPDGKWLLYQDRKGMEDIWRKHHTSSVTRDVWRYDVATGKHTNLTSRGGEDLNPVVSPDGTTAYFISERNGDKSLNVWSFPVGNPSKVSRITDFTTHPVRFLSIAGNGTLAFTYDGELYTMRPGASATKVAVDVVIDEEIPDYKTSVRSSAGAKVSPDGKQVAFVDRGEVFVTSVEYPTTRQITHTPQGEGLITWNTDNRSMVYVSERDGHYALYEASVGRKDDLNFPNATTIDERPLFSDNIERTYPQYSPDGKSLAFIEGRNKLMVMDVATGKVRRLTDGSANPERDGGFYYVWSPDSRWIAFELTGNGHEPYADVAIVNTEGTPKVTNITRSSYFDTHPGWALDGNAIAFGSDRYGMRSHASWGSQEDVMLVFLNQDAYDKYRLSKEDYELRKELEKQQKEDKDKAEKAAAGKKKGKDKKKKDDKNDDDDAKADKKTINVEFDGLRDRMVRVTPMSSSLGDFIVTDDGETLYFFAEFDDGYDLWKTDLRKHETSMVKKLGYRHRSIQTDKDGNTLYLLGSDGLGKMSVSSETIKPIKYSATMKIDPKAEREYMFNYVKQEEAARFYEKNMHGVDWEAMTEAYRKFLPHINNNYDFADLLSELLGELNVSHTGGRYYPSASGERTASLGLFFDWDYYGDGLRVAEVIEGGPFDHANTVIKKGTIIEKINGVALNDSTDYTSLLADIAGKKTLVTLYNGNGNSVDEVVLPITQGRLNDLLYRRWVKQREADTERMSGGRLGYVHLRSMDDASFRRIYTDLLGKYVDKEGIVIDTRWNGGGRLHEDIEMLFSGDKYLTQVIRGTDVCDMPSRRWNKPSIMVQCEANYSNAHGTPWVYKHKGMGKLVGMPVPGTMTSVNWETLQDPSLIFGIPVIGYRTAEGNYLENSQLEPDIKVANDPATVVKGVDTQLQTAVEELLRQIDSTRQ